MQPLGKLLNPFEDPLRFQPRTPPCALVIFGASGDLTKRKLVPALYNLAYRRRLPPGFAVVGMSRTPFSDDQFRDRMREAVNRFHEDTPFVEDLWRSFAQSLFYKPGDVDKPEAFAALRARLGEIERERQTGGNAVFYMSTQPSQYEPIAAGIGEAGLSRGQGFRRFVIEKPFGHDLSSAQALDRALHRVFDESQIYRIDHYLGKETVQNILAFRFGNGIFEPLWNRRYIDHVQITAAESIGVEGRGAYYEQAGALRDMIQNHLLQVLSTVAMEAPARYEPGAVRDERAKILRSIRPLTPEEVRLNAVAGQYGPARIGDADVPGYRQEKSIAVDSQVDTYAAVTFHIDNWRWAGIPFFLRTGKRLPKRVTDVAIQFKAAPHDPFDPPGAAPQLTPNVLVLRIQPQEGISLRFLSKQPGLDMSLRNVSMDFNYGASFGTTGPTGYETLLLDAMVGDPTLYIRQDAVEASWAAVQPILDVWADAKFNFPNYAAGTWGPKAAEEMLTRYGRAWRTP